jgi:hypothetical protein
MSNSQYSSYPDSLGSEIGSAASTDFEKEPCYSDKSALDGSARSLSSSEMLMREALTEALAILSSIFISFLATTLSSSLYKLFLFRLINLSIEGSEITILRVEVSAGTLEDNDDISCQSSLS